MAANSGARGAYPGRSTTGLQRSEQMNIRRVAPLRAPRALQIGGYDFTLGVLILLQSDAIRDSVSALVDRAGVKSVAYAVRSMDIDEAFTTGS